MNVLWPVLSRDVRKGCSAELSSEHLLHGCLRKKDKFSACVGWFAVNCLLPSTLCDALS